MVRVHVICEGQTEEMFVNQFLSLTFQFRNIYLFPSLIGKPGHKGGNFKYQRFLVDLKSRLHQDRNAICTSFFDYYGLPNDFPGKQESQRYSSAAEKYEAFLEHFLIQLSEDIDQNSLRRFVPYIQMYEFEALLFSDPDSFARGIYRDDLAPAFLGIRSQFANPEEINDSPLTAPSKRIKAIFEQYDKVYSGALAAMEVGLDAMRRECPLFNNWLSRLEMLS